MLYTRLAAPGNIAILHIYEQLQNAVHLKEKERGFRDYFQDKATPRHTIVSYDFSGYTNLEFDRELISCLERDQIAAIFVSTSRVLT